MQARQASAPLVVHAAQKTQSKPKLPQLPGINKPRTGQKQVQITFCSHLRPSDP